MPFENGLDEYVASGKSGLNGDSARMGKLLALSCL